MASQTTYLQENRILYTFKDAYSPCFMRPFSFNIQITFFTDV